MRIHRLLIAAAFIVLALASAHAQIGIYGEYTGSVNNFEYTNGSRLPAQSGGTFGVFRDNNATHIASIGLDARGSFLHGSNSTSVDGGLAGFRFALHPHVLPIMPYAQLMAGITHTSAVNTITTNFQTAVIAGADYTLLPHLDWRVVELNWSHDYGANPWSPFSFSSGIVIRLR